MFSIMVLDDREKDTLMVDGALSNESRPTTSTIASSYTFSAMADISNPADVQVRKIGCISNGKQAHHKHLPRNPLSP
jgi:hypothetical protein